MPAIEHSDLLEVLACDIEARPPAPGPDELLPFVTGVHRDPQAVTCTFQPAAAADFSRFVEAERLCCTGIGWDLIEGPALKITATPAQLDAIEQLFRASSD